jgi:flagellar assembly factor FliW
MIKFETSRFGELEVSEDKIIFFPDGIPGFREIKRYILLDYKDTPLKWLQAVDDPDVAFIVVQPEYLFPDYSVKIDKSIEDLLKLKNNNDLAVLLIIRVEDEKIIPNINGPLLINAETKIGMQIVLDKT